MILTRAQRCSLYKVWLRTVEAGKAEIHKSGTFVPSYRMFRRRVQPGWDCVMVPFAGMWLGIERDGYTHS